MLDDEIKIDVDTSELIDVREGEELNEAALTGYLKGKLEGADGKIEIMQFGGGHANLTYRLKFGDIEYTLRRPPLGPVAASSHDMGREFKILSNLYKVFPAAPRAYLYCEDLEVIGAPFFIMERKNGIVVRGTVPAAYGGGEDSMINRTLSEVLIDTLAELHRVDYKAIGLEDLGKPKGYMMRQVTGWAGRFEKAKTQDIDVFGELVEWLEQKIPASTQTSILHNDYRLDNIMLDSNDPGKLVAVFDWDMGTLGDPLADMGCLLSFWLEQGEGGGFGSSGGVMPTQVDGFMARQEAIERYGEKTGFDIKAMQYYYAFGQFKMAGILQQIFYRYDKGQTKDKRFKFFGMLAELMIRMAHGNAVNSGL